MAGEFSDHLSHALMQAMIAAANETLPAQQEAAAQARTDFFETGEAEIAAIWREKGLPDFNDPELPEALRQAFGSITEPTHQMDFFFSILALLGLALSGGQAAAAGYASQIENRSMHAQGDVQPDIAILAQLANADVMTGGDAAESALFQGYRSGSFNLIREAAQAYPPFGTLLDLLRRKWIGDADFDLAMRRQGYGPAYVSLMKHLKEGPPDLGLVVSAVTQSQIDDATFKDLLAQNGIDPKWSDVIFKTAGQSPPVDLTLNLWNRGLIDEAIVDKIILESPIKNEYVPVLKQMRWRFPPMEQTISMIHRKSITPEKGREWLSKLGYQPDAVDGFMKWATTKAKSSTKELSQAVTLQMYDASVWDRARAQSHLEALGLDADDATELLDLHDALRKMRRDNQSATKIHTRYVSWKIDRSEAQTALDAIGLSAEARDDLLDNWDVERDAQTLHLTRTDIKKAFANDLLTIEQARARLLGMGYEPEDATIVMELDGIK